MADPRFDALDQELAHCAAGYRGGAGIAPLEHGRRVIASLLRHPEWDDQHVDFQVQLLQQGGGILLNLYKARGDRTVLDEALTILTLGTNLLEEGHGSRPALLANLGLALRIVGEDDSSPETVLKAIACLETSIAGTAYSDPDRPNRLSNLGNAWRTHHDQTGDPASLDKAIDCLDKAFALRPSVDLASNLSVGLRDRFAASGSRADLEHALHLASGAVDATPPEAPGLAVRLNNLSILHAHRFELDRHEDDGRAALDLLVRIVEMTPEGSPDLGYRLLNLGNMHRRMFTVTAMREAIAFAAKVYAKALAFARYGPDGMAMIRSAYADALSVLGALEQDVQQTELAVNLAREALAAISPGHAERHSYLSSLAQALQRHGTLLREADWLREAEALLSGGLDTGPHARPTAILLALNRARISAELFVLTGDEQDARRAMHIAQGAVRALQARSIEGSLERANVEIAATVATDIAMLMAAIGDGAAAAVCFESARTVRFNAEVSAAGMPACAPEAADKVIALQARIRAHRTLLERRAGGSQAERAQVAAALDTDLATLHALAGNDPLARALGIDDIHAIAAQAGSVLAYLHASDEGGVAVLVTDKDVQCLSLPQLAEARARLHAEAIGDDQTNTGWFVHYRRAFGADASDEGHTRWEAALPAFLAWLGAACAEPLMIAVAALGAGRLTILPTNELALLPLHAATLRDGRPLLSHVECSTAPSAVLLGAALELLPAEGQTLAIGDADGDLPFARIEAGLADTAPLVGTAATGDTVLAALPNAARVHLAVHGRFDSAAPLESAFYLTDAKVTLAALLSGDVRLLRGATMIASACESGLFDRAVGASEQIGFGGALLAAGARRIVASLWPVSDLSTALMMQRMLALEAVGASLAAALNEAIDWLRTADQATVARALDQLAQDLPPEADDLRALLAVARDAIAADGPAPFAHPQYWAPFAMLGAPD